MTQRIFYTRKRTIGKGGHGYVDEVVNQNGETFARKKLTHLREGKAYARFKSEIDVLLQLNVLPGVIKIIDHYFPEKFSKQDPPFYVMSLGESFTNFIKDKPHDQLFILFLKICKTFEALHARDITHRDIKPSNMLIIKGEPVISDFGLANFPLKEKVSEPDEAIGAKWTIAPEMERISSSAAYKKADVYSLAKTLWILITGNVKGFEGQYIPYSSISLDKYISLNVNKGYVVGDWHYFSIVLLEQLLVESTSNDPDQRPSIINFTQRLAYWFRTNSEYFERNPYEWADALKRIFPMGIPTHCEWNSLTDILAILKILTQYDNLNHCFLPPRGGIDMDEVKIATESGCLNIENEIVKPEALHFEFLDDPKWSYFRLDFAPLRPLSNKHDGLREYLHLSQTGRYTFEDKDENIEVTRYLKGSLIITSKTSPINQSSGPMDGYSGIHYKMTPAEYRTGWELMKNGKEQELSKLIGNRNTNEL